MRWVDATGVVRLDFMQGGKLVRWGDVPLCLILGCIGRFTHDSSQTLKRAEYAGHQ